MSGFPVHRQTVAGVPVLVVEDHSLPYTRFILALRGGATQDPPGRAGLCRLLMELSLRGAGRWDRQAFNAAVEEKGSQLFSVTGADVALLRGAALSAHLESTLALAFTALLEPTLAEEELGRLATEVADGLRAERDDDDAVAELFLRRSLYRTHPLSRSPAGEVADVAAATGAEVRALHRSMVCRDHLIVGLAGDVSAAAAETMLLPWLQGLPAAAGAAAMDPLPELPGWEVWVVDKPERTQAQLRLACRGVAGRDAAALPLWLGVTAFGGTFTSPFSREVRDLRGWSYVAHAGFDRRGLWPTPVVLRSAPATTDAVACLALERELFAALARGDLPRPAIELARDYLCNRDPLERQSCAHVLPLVVRHELCGLPTSVLGSTPTELAAVDLDALGSTLAQVLGPHRAVGVLVATAAEVVPALRRELGEDAVRVIDYRDGLAPAPAAVDIRPRLEL
jgi:zinc protease